MKIYICRFIDILKEGGTNDIKECPICQVLIQRDAGCAQMMCGNCKHMFCWHCRKSLDVSRCGIYRHRRLKFTGQEIQIFHFSHVHSERMSCYTRQRQKIPPAPRPQKIIISKMISVCKECKCSKKYLCIH